MSLWKHIESTFTKHTDNIWIQYYAKATGEKVQLTFSTIFNITEEILKHVPNRDTRDLIGCVFEDNTNHILGVFPAILASLR